MASSSLGPVLSATLVTPDLPGTVAAYCEYLQLKIASHEHVPLKLARQWGLPKLTGASMVWLGNALGESWLRVIELADADVVDPFDHQGWLSLEISVQDVDALRTGLDNSPFKIIGEPANLDVSDDIRAMQVIGPAGEVLYLTEIKAEVPPFELPFARCPVDRLFIPVLLTRDRDRMLEMFEAYPGTSGLKFDTKITVINRARGLDIERKHPVATLQLKGKTLIEIDQLDELKDRPLTAAGLPTGIALITLQSEQPPAGGKSLLQGPGGEFIEVTQIAS